MKLGGWIVLAACAGAALAADVEMRLMTVDPAHFHAAQVHAKPMRGFSREAWVYAPVGKDVGGHFNFISNLKLRSTQPDHWLYHGYFGSDFFAKMLQDRPGNVVFLSGRNWKTIDYVEQSVAAGLHVLADKPWIIESAQFAKLEQTLNTAESKGLIAYDCMSQRYEIAYQLQRELVNDPEIFGAPIAGTPQRPTVEMASTHFLLKRFNGVANLRPAAYFDVKQQGEALADVGTHVVDLTHWTLFPNQSLDYKRDIHMVSARRWPTVLSLQQFAQVTGEAAFPKYLDGAIREGSLHYFTNGEMLYTVRGHHVKLGVTWDYESPSGASDSMLAVYRGARSEVMVRQSSAEKYIPEVYVATTGANRATVLAAIDNRLKKLAARYPGLSRTESGDMIRIVVPPSLRIPDIEYFVLLAEQFGDYVRTPGTLPAWEKPNMLAKYWVTTQGVKMARGEQ